MKMEFTDQEKELIMDCLAKAPTNGLVWENDLKPIYTKIKSSLVPVVPVEAVEVTLPEETTEAVS